MSQEHTVSPDPSQDFSPVNLRKILEEYARFKFKGAYGVEFKGNDTKPKDLNPPDDSTRTLSSITKTLVIKNNQWGGIDGIINTEIISHLNIPDWLKDSLKADLKEQFLSIKRDAVESAIKSAKYSKTYPDPLIRPLFWKSLATLTFTNEVASDGTRTYISVLGVFYSMVARSIAPEEA